MDIINNKKIISQHSKSFFWASRFLPRDVLGKVINIYSYCRLHDDIVDEGKELTESEKMQDLNAIDLKGAINMVKGSAVSMGMEVVS